MGIASSPFIHFNDRKPSHNFIHAHHCTLSQINFDYNKTRSRTVSTMDKWYWMGDRRYIKTTICDKWHQSHHFIFVLKCVWRYNLIKLHFHLLVIWVDCFLFLGHIYDSLGGWGGEGDESSITEICVNCGPCYCLKQIDFKNETAKMYGPSIREQICQLSM